MLSSRACRRGKRRLNKSTILISQYVLNEILRCLLSMSAVAVVGRGGGFNLSLPDYFRHNLENLGFTWYKPYQLRIIIRARRVIFKLSTFSTTFFFFPTPVPGIWLNNWELRVASIERYWFFFVFSVFYYLLEEAWRIIISRWHHLECVASILMKFNFDVFGDESESYNLIFARLSAMPPARHSYRPPGVFIEFSHLSFMSFLLPE